MSSTERSERENSDTDSNPQSNREKLRKSKKQYQKVLSTVYHQTSPKQPPMVEKAAIKRTCCVSGGLDPDTVTSKLQAAVTNGDLIRSDGRYCVTDDIPRLKRAAQAVAEQVPVNQQLLGEINTTIHTLREGEDGSD